MIGDTQSTAPARRTRSSAKKSSPVIPAEATASTPTPDPAVTSKSTTKRYDYKPVIKKRKKQDLSTKHSVNIFNRAQAYVAKGFGRYLLSHKNATRRIKKMDPKKGKWTVSRRAIVNGKSESWVICPVCQKEFSRQNMAHHRDKVKVNEEIMARHSC